WQRHGRRRARHGPDQRRRGAGELIRKGEGVPHMSGKLLSLDLSGDIGWATFDVTRPAHDRVRFGTLPWRGQGHAAIAGKFMDWLHDFYSVERWDAMAWEEPWLQPGDKVDKMKILIGLPIIACGFANSERHKMPFTTVT